MEGKEPETVKVQLKFVHHHFGDVLNMVAQGKTVYVENGLRKIIVAVIMRPDMVAQQSEDANAKS